LRLLGIIRHPGGAPALAISPDGRMMLSGGYDRIARIWRLADRRLLRQLPGHEGTIWSVAWSPDGQRLATAGEDKTIRIWRAADGALLHVLRGHDLNVWVVRFSPDSRLLASGSFDHSIRLWDAETGALVRRLPGHAQAVVNLAFSPDGRLLASGGDDSTVRLWRISDGAQLASSLVDRSTSTRWLSVPTGAGWPAAVGREARSAPSGTSSPGGAPRAMRFGSGVSPTAPFRPRSSIAMMSCPSLSARTDDCWRLPRSTARMRSGG
jgi:WD40 repeat protein